jgi:ubiquitin carboxyl-terminal hydrolase L3
MIPQPALGILFLYEETPAQQVYKQEEALTLSPDIPNNVFFMRQYARNACGTIALFHIVLNALEQHPDLITAGSYLDNFRVNASNIDPQARGELFKENK